MTELKVEKISKSYPGDQKPVKVLSDISFCLPKGKTLAIVGPSGSGKTTLLQILGCLMRADSGRVFWEGKVLNKANERYLESFRGQNMGFIFQFHYLLSDFTCLENVMIPLLIQGYSKKQSQRQASEFLGNLGLSQRVDHFPNQLSGGERQRVALARASVHQPSLLFADEPTGNLDQKMGTKVFDLLLELNKESNATLVVVTHNRQLAARMDYQLELVDGQCQAYHKTDA